MQNTHQICFFRYWLVVLLAISITAKGNDSDSHGVVSGFGTAQSGVGLQVRDGWYVHDGSVVWGNAQHNGWWRAGQRPNLTRNAPGQIRPNRTEDLEKLTDNMLRYWWYQPDGSLFAPKSGTQMPGRYVTRGAAQTTPQQNYRQIKEYRLKYPEKGILQQMEASRQQTWAFLMGGGSLLIRYLSYPGQQDPPMYVAPADSAIILPLYKFIREYLADSLYHTRPLDVVLDRPEHNWCLAWKNNLYLIYALKGSSFRLNLTEANGVFKAKWLDPRTGRLQTADSGKIKAGRIVTFTAPSQKDWALWLTK